MGPDISSFHHILIAIPDHGAVSVMVQLILPDLISNAHYGIGLDLLGPWE